MKTALFTNFSTEEFTGYWDGKGKKFAPGQSMYMPDYLANVFAKHLVNRELQRANDPKLDRCTSPKKPEDVPQFMELFHKAYTPDENDVDETEGKDTLDVQMEVVSRNKPKPGEGNLQTPIDDEDEDEDDGFQDKPKDEVPAAKK